MTLPENHTYFERYNTILKDPVNALIKRHPEAGNVVDGNIIMWNGLKVEKGCYYDVFTDILELNKGIHEPTEEYLFDIITDSIGWSPIMIELGSYWAFYSMCLKQKRPYSRCYMIDEEEKALRVGERQFALNGFNGEFIHNRIADNAMNLDDFCSKRGIGFIDVLHSDIQGFEIDMLHGATDYLRNSSIGNIFISTHSNEIHYECLNFLKAFDYNIVISQDMDETYCLDGIIVAQSGNYSPFIFKTVNRNEL